ncbi:hypothetical protein NDU88_005818 [Pleurodeles waltl]|uniref:Uncharacterized protein n=1 Tax=Pleurodeles waltl TaxID=8319 RepID=A0AAV7TDB2_PLEWA|nr:hypothetical protein NDU88_005818 [Pleurodeles waltl]
MHGRTTSRLPEGEGSKGEQALDPSIILAGVSGRKGDRGAEVRGEKSQPEWQSEAEEGEDGEKERIENEKKERTENEEKERTRDTAECGGESQEEDGGTETRGDGKQDEDGVTENPGD